MSSSSSSRLSSRGVGHLLYPSVYHSLEERRSVWQGREREEEGKGKRGKKKEEGKEGEKEEKRERDGGGVASVVGKRTCIIQKHNHLWLGVSNTSLALF